MANDGRSEGSRAYTGLCTSSACTTCTTDFNIRCGIYWWVTRTAGTRSGVVHYKLQMCGDSGYMYTYTLRTYDTYLNGGNWGTIEHGTFNRYSWYDVGAETSQGFTYNENGTAPAVWINGGGAQFTIRPYCKSAGTTSIGGFNVYPDSVPVDWQRVPSGPSASVSGVNCTGATLSFNIQDKGIPASTTSYIQYGTTTSYGSQTGTSSAQSGSFTITGLQPATTYHFRSVTYNSTGTVRSGDMTFKTKGTLPSAGTPTATSLAPYRLSFTLPSITWEGSDGCNVTSKSAKLTWSYTMDGKNYSFTQNFSNPGSSISYDTGVNMDRVPDGETVSYTWTLTSNIGTTTKTGSVYAQTSYDAWVTGPSTNYEWVEATLFASEKAGINSYKEIRRVNTLT